MPHIMAAFRIFVPLGFELLVLGLSECVCKPVAIAVFRSMKKFNIKSHCTVQQFTQTFLCTCTVSIYSMLF